MGNFIQLDRLEVLGFFDYPEDTRHANAMVAMFGEELGAGLMKLYLERSEGASVQVLPEPCNQRTRSGHRLDRWILAKWPEHEILFQVEIKNWSANSINSKRLALDASPETIAIHKRQRWSTIWHEGEQRFREIAVGKVLTPMKSLRDEKIEPALCMWDAMHPAGETAPWFSVSLPGEHHFARFWVFSMSAFLRTLSEPYLTLEMPDTVRRLDWMHKLLPTVEVST